MKGRYSRTAGQSARHRAQFRVRGVRKSIRRVQECCGSSDASLSMSAIRPSSGSERAFILCIRRLRCTFTVASAMPISPAICLLTDQNVLMIGRMLLLIYMRISLMISRDPQIGASSHASKGTFP